LQLYAISKIFLIRVTAHTLPA